MSGTVFILVFFFVVFAAGAFLSLIFRTVQGIWADLGWADPSKRELYMCSYSGGNGHLPTSPRKVQVAGPKSRPGTHRPCPNQQCQRVNVPEAVFCGRCGRPLSRGSTSR